MGHMALTTCKGQWVEPMLPRTPANETHDSLSRMKNFRIRRSNILDLQPASLSQSLAVARQFRPFQLRHFKF